jgi:hypothetical protein
LGRKTLVLHLVGCALGALLFLPVAASAYDESTATVPPFTEWNEGNCGRCHSPYFSIRPVVHGGYATATKKCISCHATHDAQPSSILLLPSSTIQGSCDTCHDGTGGRGVYGSIAARGLLVGARHRCETTNVVPGGNALTGGDATMTLSGANRTLTCTDCHSVHGANVVAAFTAERRRTTSFPAAPTTNLLKQRPGNSASSTTVYGSDWCGACHRGRLSGTGLHTHPVDSSAVRPAPPGGTFSYERVAVLTTVAPTSATTTGTLGGSNLGYLMPFPRTAQQNGHSPICQQCHEDSRFTGTIDPSGAPADAATFTVSQQPDGVVATDNPRFQNFPHETVNTRMLVEPGDDLCTNCHPVGILP